MRMWAKIRYSSSQFKMLSMVFVAARNTCVCIDSTWSISPRGMHVSVRDHMKTVGFSSVYSVLWHVLLVSLFGYLYEICHTVLSILGTYVVLVCCPCPKVFTRRNDESVILAIAFCEQGYWIASILEVRKYQLSTC